jgi:hypothetical protein
MKRFSFDADNRQCADMVLRYRKQEDAARERLERALANGEDAETVDRLAETALAKQAQAFEALNVFALQTRQSVMDAARFIDRISEK